MISGDDNCNDKVTLVNRLKIKYSSRRRKLNFRYEMDNRQRCFNDLWLMVMLHFRLRRILRFWRIIDQLWNSSTSIKSLYGYSFHFSHKLTVLKFTSTLRKLSFFDSESKYCNSFGQRWRSSSTTSRTEKLEWKSSTFKVSAIEFLFQYFALISKLLGEWNANTGNLNCDKDLRSHS